MAGQAIGHPGFIQQTQVATPLFIMDEVDKAILHDYGNSGTPHDALLDLLEPGNAWRFTDVLLMTECDLSHCLYVQTTNSLQALPEPLQSRLRMVFFRPLGQNTLKSLRKEFCAIWIRHGVFRQVHSRFRPRR